MSKHTPEPWYVVNGNKIYRRPEIDIYEYSGNKGAGIAGDKAIAICDKGWYGKNETGFTTDANAARIAACVNACAGMADPSAEIAQLRADKARLIEALQALYEKRPLSHISAQIALLIAENEK